jgi:ribosomal protein L11 methyltransferase
VLEIAAYNAARNRIDDRIEIIETDLIPRNRGPFDLVLCNILAPEVVRLAADLPLLLAPGGVVIVSGFILASVPDVAAAMEQAGLRVLAEPEEGEWAAVVAQAPGGEEAT